MNTPVTHILLPPPPAGKTGWPWTEETPAAPETLPDGQPWPRISIVTPSFNQGQFLEETIRSVLLQGYPNLEYILIDGGSTDNSVEIIRRYEPWLAYWVSEKDDGQSHAINKGFARSTGQIMGWVNSDDGYLPGAFISIAQEFAARNCSWLTGGVLHRDIWHNPEIETCLYKKPSLDDVIFQTKTLLQAATLWSRQAWEQAGPLREDLHFAMDYDLWIRMYAVGGSPQFLDLLLAYITTHPDMKSQEKNCTATYREGVIALMGNRPYHQKNRWSLFLHRYYRIISRPSGWHKYLPRRREMAILFYPFSVHSLKRCFGFPP